MTTPERQNASIVEIEEDLQRLEHGIRQLKIQYEQFFGGGLKRPPTLLRSQVNKIIKRWSEKPMRKYHHRFHFNALVSRYSIFAELWDKRVRQTEEGCRSQPLQEARQRKREIIVARCPVRDPAQSEAALRDLYRAYLRTSRDCGGSLAQLSFEKFYRSVSAQAGNLQKKAGCDEIELRVILKNRKVALKARPRR